MVVANIKPTKSSTSKKKTSTHKDLQKSDVHQQKDEINKKDVDNQKDQTNKKEVASDEQDNNFENDFATAVNLKQQKKSLRQAKAQSRKEKRKAVFSKLKRNKKAKFNSSFEHVIADPNIGLNDQQLQERVDRGMTNVQPNVVTKSYFKIFRTNVITLFNIINFFLATLILMYGNLKNLSFMIIVLFNIVVGIVQEIRSKRTLETMSLLTTAKVNVVRNGQIVQVDMSELVMDDIIILKQGEQVPADCVVAMHECEANESLLTGEQDDVHKGIGDNLLSGSFIQAGTCYARVTAVGKDNFSAKIMSEAKKFKKSSSQLMSSINWIIRIDSIAIFPLGLFMFITNFRASSQISSAITSTVASVIGMIPSGLIVLTSIALAAGVVKLAKKKTLVQELYCIETLARVDCLCLDKTGTITEGSMQVEQTHIYSTKFGFVDDIMDNMVKVLGSEGATFEAFAKYFHSNETYESCKTIPFSSSRKWSGVDFGSKGKFIVGAPEFVLKSQYSLVENDCKEFTAQGFRVLVLVRTTETLTEKMDETKMKPIALIVLSDKIRENARETFEYFAKQGVMLKVISGDNPITVSKVAERAGLMGADKYIDASQDLDTEEKIYDACDKYTIFGRVNPKQKKMLVSSLKKKGYTVGMTGDGVNDVMALKEADCSIAMASGSEASRNVAQLVLLDSDFSSLPSVVAEGRRVINNIERAASLFLVKTTFSVVLSLLFIIFQFQYPFEPIQLSWISDIFVGVPSFFLALEPNDAKVEGKFLSKVFKKALPAGLTVALMVWIISFKYNNIGVDVSAQISTMAFWVTAFVSFLVLLQVCMPYTKERLFLIALCAVIFVASTTSSFLAELFAIVPLTTNMMLNLIIILLCVIPCIAFMRAQVGAMKGLILEFYGFCKGIYIKFKNVDDKRKQKRLESDKTKQRKKR